MNVFLLLFPLVLVLALVLRSCSWARVVPGAVSVHVFLLLFPLALVLTLVLRSCFRTSIFLQKITKNRSPGGGGYPSGGKKCFSGGLGPKIPSKTRFGGDFKAMLGPKLGVKILHLC